VKPGWPGVAYGPNMIGAPLRCETCDRTQAYRFACALTLDRHLAAQNSHDLDAILGGSNAFSEVRIDERRRHLAEAAIIVEQTISGRHTGPWQGLPPRNRIFGVPACTIYLFDAGARLQSERVHLDRDLLRRQLQAG
jgi:hypothetical protein